LLQIDNQHAHNRFAESRDAMVPAYNADYAAGFLQYLLSLNNNNEKGSLSAYNAGLPTRCGARTNWAGVPKRLCYADSVFRHQQRILNIPNPCRLLP
jgi:soluble lytic murein transglycosylase-like protein